MASLTQSEDFIVTEIQGLQTVIYVENINFLTGEDPEIIHKGNLEFTIYGIGRGQQPNYFMVTTVDGIIAEVESTSTCDFDSCARGMDLSINFDASPREVSGGEFSRLTGDYSDGDTATFYNEPLLVTFGGSSPSEPQGWQEALETPDYKASVETGIQSTYCAGDTASAKIRLENQVVAGDTSVTLQVANQITGDVSERSVTIPPEGTTETVDVTIPQGVNADDTPLMFVGVNDERVYQDSARIGASSSEIAISNVQMPDSVMAGEQYDGSLEVGNVSDCDVEITVSSNTEVTN